MVYRLPYRVFASLLWLSVLAAGLAGCATTPPPVPVVVTGNGHCQPAADLPAHKTMKKVPEVETFMENLYAMFLGERKDHAKDIADYNSLYDTCVGGKASSTTK
ncbi:hypothetical protein GC176_20480 [bacterium]|nr:hypothetical protein [bacterium]